MLRSLFDKRLFFQISLIALVVIIAAGPGLCADPDLLAKDADKVLRASERAMFNGKTDESAAKLAEAAELIDELKEAEPEHKKLKTLQNKLNKITKDLARRTKKSTVSSSSTSSSKSLPPKPSTSSSSSPSSSSSATLPPKPSSKPKSSASSSSSSPLMERSIKGSVRDVDFALNKLEKHMSFDDSFMKVQQSDAEKVRKAEGYLIEAENYLKKTEDKYGDQLPDPNEAFIAARTKIEHARQKVNDWAVELGQQSAAAAQAEAKAGAKAGAALETAQADAAKMVELYNTYYDDFEMMTGNMLAYSTKPEEYEKALKTIETAEAALAKFASELGRLADTYGSDSMSISRKLFDMGLKRPEGNPGNKLGRLIETAGKIGETRKATGESAMNNAKNLLGAFSGQLTDARIERMGEAKKLLVLGKKIDPANTEIDEMLAKIDDQIAEAVDKMQATIEAATWKGNIADFSGPGDVDDLADQTLDYFKKDRAWGAKDDVDVLAASVRGPWQVAERDLFGRVIRWRLPIHVAVTTAKLKPRGIARVYDLSIVAMQGAPDNSPKKPPFDGFWVGDNWMMLITNLP